MPEGGGMFGIGSDRSRVSYEPHPGIRGTNGGYLRSDAIEDVDVSVWPLYAKREQRLLAEGGRKPKCERGEPVKDDRSGGAPGLHKRGLGSAEDWG